MATIALYANKINQMPGLINDVKKSVVNYKSELSSLKGKSLNINKSVCNLDDIISSIQTASQTQERKINSLETISKESEEFISEAVRIDGEAADVINERKDDFYEEYYYLKPDCEKSGWERFCDTCKSVVDWCRENWQSIGKILIAVVIIVGLGIATALTGGLLGVILAGAFWGALAGGLIGGVIGGIMSVAGGGSFLDGFADGILSGAVTGAITGAAFAGLGALGAVAGKGINCLSTLGRTISVTSKVANVISISLDGFDLLAMGISLFDPTNPLVVFNQQLHSSKLFNGFQIFVNALAVFTAGAVATMKCFVAGTLILTSAGLVAIECIKAGDKVISTDAETFEVAEKTVVETYVRETNELLNITINGELIKTTLEHPFFVKDVGFVNAGELQVGDKLLDSKGNILVVDSKNIEITDAPIKVYNFQVDDFHTYHVGDNGVLVHNANYSSGPKDPSKWVDKDGNINWPPNRGFDGDPTPVTLQPGTRVDRYGYDGGTFVSPEGTPYPNRALAPGTDSKPYTVFEVVKPIDALEGKIAPWFDEPGGGIQYEFDKKISELLREGILRKVGS